MAGFWAGFGTQLSQNIEERRAYARDRAAKRQEYLQTYGTRAVVEREEQANAAVGTANYLISQGIPKEDVRYVLDTSGIQGLVQLKSTLDSRDDLRPDEKKALVKQAKDYTASNPQEDITTVVERAYGLYQSTDNPVKRERNIFSAMLGLDAGMMEDEVLDDLYVNGYTGRDLYRIMGSSVKSTGSPLDLNLPIKPLSASAQAAAARVLQDQFEASVDGRISIIQSEKGKIGPDDGAGYAKLMAEQEELVLLKAQGLVGMAEYAQTYDPGLFDFAATLEEMNPGAITRNGNLGNFPTLYQSYMTEDRDTDTDTQTKDALSRQDPVPADHVFNTKAERDAAIRSGIVKKGDTVSVRGSEPSVYNGPTMEPNKDLRTNQPAGSPFDPGPKTGRRGLGAKQPSIFDELEEAAAVSADISPPVVNEPEFTATTTPDEDIKDLAKEIAKGDLTYEQVREKVLEAGIEMPTNKQELSWFTDDLKSFVEEYGATIPEDYLRRLADEAITLGVNQETSETDFRTALEKVLQDVDFGTDLNEDDLDSMVNKAIEDSKGALTPEDKDIVRNAIKRKLNM